LKALDEIPVAYLKLFSQHGNLYEICPIEVKRQIWQIQETLFRDTVWPLIEDYVGNQVYRSHLEEKKSIESIQQLEESLFQWAHEMPLDNGLTPPLPSKRRSENKPLQALLNCIGKSTKLYNLVIHFLRLLYANSKMNGMYCALRFDLLMALHDANVVEIVDIERCYKFAWCLDACIRDRKVDQRRVQEMKIFFDTINEGEPILGDLAMIVANPFVSNMLIRNIFDTLLDLKRKSEVPKYNENLWYFTLLYSLGLNAHRMLRSSAYQFPALEKDIVKQFYPLLSELIVAEEEKEERVLEASLESFLLERELPRTLVLYYLLYQMNKNASCTLIGKLITAVSRLPRKTLVRERAFLQSLVTLTLSTKQLVKNPRIRLIVVDNFLLKYAHVSFFVHKQLVRFLLEIHLRIPVKDLLGYLQKLIGRGLLDSINEMEDKQKQQQQQQQHILRRFSPLYQCLLERLLSFPSRIKSSQLTFLFEFLGLPLPILEDKEETQNSPSSNIIYQGFTELNDNVSRGNPPSERIPMVTRSPVLSEATSPHDRQDDDHTQAHH